jgi:hypothetical protein
MSSVVFSLALDYSIKNNVKNNSKQCKFSIPNNKNLKNYKLFPSNQKFSITCRILVRYVFYLQIINLMSKNAKVKREVKGQGERSFTKIITITHF